MITTAPAPHELNLDEEQDRQVVARRCLAFACLFTSRPLPTEDLSAEQYEDALRAMADEENATLGHKPSGADSSMILTAASTDSSSIYSGRDLWEVLSTEVYLYDDFIRILNHEQPMAFDQDGRQTPDNLSMDTLDTEETTMTTNRRTCFHSDESFMTEDGAYVVVEITEGEPGYLRTSHVDRSLIQTQAIAAEHNSTAGLTPDDVLDIRTSSMAAGPVPQ